MKHVARNGAVQVTAPAGTATRTLTLTTFDGSATSKLNVLGPARFRVAAASKVRRGTTLKVRVRGLAPGERVTLKWRGRKVAVARATNAGRARLQVKVSVRTSRGGKAFAVVGQFGDRLGRGKVTVI